MSLQPQESIRLSEVEFGLILAKLAARREGKLSRFELSDRLARIAAHQGRDQEKPDPELLAYQRTRWDAELLGKVTK